MYTTNGNCEKIEGDTPYILGKYSYDKWGLGKVSQSWEAPFTYYPHYYVSAPQDHPPGGRDMPRRNVAKYCYEIACNFCLWLATGSLCLPPVYSCNVLVSCGYPRDVHRFEK